MKSLTPTQRDRGLARLRRLTYGATAGALVAVVGFGYAAAASYAGKTASSTALNTTAATAAPATVAPSTDSSSSLQPAPQAPSTGSSGSGTVTSGGS
jgi:hypothetical protein